MCLVQNACQVHHGQIITEGNLALQSLCHIMGHSKNFYTNWHSFIKDINFFGGSVVLLCAMKTI